MLRQANGKAPAPVEKLVPYNVEAEEAVLGSILLDSQAYARVASFLKPIDFFRDTNRWVYEAIGALFERRGAIDFLTTRDELERLGRLDEIGGAAYLTALINVVPTSTHVEHYARIVTRDATKRRVIRAAAQIAEAAYDPDASAEAVLERAQGLLLGVPRGGENGPVSAAQAVAEAWRILETGKLAGRPTGFSDLDRAFVGLQPGRLYVLGARPGVGKTALMLNIARAFLRRADPVMLFSLEMPRVHIINRLAAIGSGLNTKRLAKGDLTQDEYALLGRHYAEMEGWPLVIDDAGSLTPDALRVKAQAEHMRRPVSLILVDYIQRMHPSKRVGNRVQEVGEVSRALKELAMELDVPVLAASSFSRQVEYRAGGEPTLSDLRESGDIESDADVVGLMWTDGTPGEDDPRTVNVKIAKHRDGGQGTVQLYFDPTCVRFGNLHRGM